MLSADFNKDGHPDLAIAGSVLTILLGNATGSFSTAAPVAAAGSCNTIAAGDFNGDGIPDLLVAPLAGNAIVLLGNGDGTFHQSAILSTSGATYLFTGDFNHDGKIDAVLVGNTVRVFLGKGDGTFSAAINTNSAGSGDGAAVGDFNRDGNLDLVLNTFISSQGSSVPGLVYLPGKGDGSFGSSQVIAQLAGSFGVFGLATADINGDGNLDLVTTVTRSASVGEVYLGKGDGTFQKPLQTSALGPFQGANVALADVNGDGLPDLLSYGPTAFGSNAAGGVSVKLGLGDGTFATAMFFPETNLQNANGALVAADFNSDGKPDVAVLGLGNIVSVLMGNGAGMLQHTANAVPVQDFAVYGVLTADLNGDGHPDVVSTGFQNVNVLLSNGNGTFQSAVPYAMVPGGYVGVTGDVNGDGIPDIITPGTNLIRVYLGKGDGTFPTTVDSATPIFRGGLLTVGDFNGDGHLDIALINPSNSGTPPGSVLILLGAGNGSFTAGHVLTGGLKSPQQVAAADFNGDGKLDVAVVDSLTNSVHVFLGTGSGNFTADVAYPAGNRAQCLTVADFDGDGHPDIAAGNASFDMNVTTLINNGDGTFHSGGSFTAVDPNAIVAYDLNNDGVPDLVVANASGDVTVFEGTGSGSFFPGKRYAVPGDATSLAVADLDGDGHADVAAITSVPGVVMAFQIIH